jgi:hypothetical protein
MNQCPPGRKKLIKIEEKEEENHKNHKNHADILSLSQQVVMAYIICHKENGDAVCRL